MDVSQFRPNELSVNLRERELIIEGHHEERFDQIGTIERHFIRKFIIPEDAQLDTLASDLTDKGVLRVTAKKAAAAGSMRNIPIKAAPRNSQEEEKDMTEKENA